MKRGEVWWVDFTAAQGSEVRKRRPAVVISNNNANRYANRVTVVPLTSQVAKVYPWEAPVTIDGKKGKAMADQITTVAKERLGHQLATVTLQELREIERAILVQLGIPS